MRKYGLVKFKVAGALSAGEFMRSLIMLISVVLASCSSNQSDGQNGEESTLLSTELDPNELSLELVMALISENQPPPRCTYFYMDESYSAEIPGTDQSERWSTGKDALPANFVLNSTQVDDPYGFKPLVEMGLLTATKVGERTEEVGGPWQTVSQVDFEVYRVDYSDEVKKSQTFVPNVNNSLTTAPRVILGYCGSGSNIISNVQYSIPDGSSSSSATFAWQSSGEDRLAENVRAQSNGTINRPSLPATNGTGSASFQLTSNGWVVDNVTFDN